jgi:hypothetical protein
VISKKASFSPTQLESLRFAIAGRVTAWDPVERRVIGHVEPPEPRWIVTVLKLDD